MAWREVRPCDQRWRVSLAAERQASSSQWSLAVAFRAIGTPGTMWVPFPLASQSQATLFAQAERIADEQLSALLAERLRSRTCTPVARRRR